MAASENAEVTIPAHVPNVAAEVAKARAAAPDDNLRLKKSIDPASGAHEKGLHFLFNGESWVEVRGKDGKVVFSMVNAPGSERIVRGDPPFSLVIGGASGVELSYNGSRVDLASYVNSDVARLRLE
jgi:cytoskeleton protein RodZ